MIRTFRATPAVAESVRAALDAAWNYPDAETKTTTAFRPANRLPKDSQGRVYLRIASRYCEYEAVAATLPDLLASGAVEEISEAEFRQVFPPRLLEPR